MSTLKRLCRLCDAGAEVKLRVLIGWRTISIKIAVLDGYESIADLLYRDQECKIAIFDQKGLLNR